ncbi:hypothetical protein [Microvirgula aerodenitrificans]|uniref:hypothetical protein n=1 Tax=Microvirgula aerodenitrificans TaxID=57480 RepID=UPI0028E48A4F|nr:hypothetical protein [Microvirgula aerodenitrificans]
MRLSEIKSKLISILTKEISLGPGFLIQQDLELLILHVEQDKLTKIDRENIATHVLANYLHENTEEIEELIDWVTRG